MRFSFFLVTLFAGMLMEIVSSRYLSVRGIAPQMLLLLVIAHGFILGPIMAESLGFAWGLMADATGVSLFGLQTFLLALGGYIAGRFRRRIASERATTQMVVAFLASVFYGIGVFFLHSAFEAKGGRVYWEGLLLQTLLNIAAVTIVFALTEFWIRVWKVGQGV